MHLMVGRWCRERNHCILALTSGLGESTCMESEVGVSLASITLLPIQIYFVDMTLAPFTSRYPTSLAFVSNKHTTEKYVTCNLSSHLKNAGQETQNHSFSSKHMPGFGVPATQRGMCKYAQDDPL